MSTATAAPTQSNGQSAPAAPANLDPWTMEVGAGGSGSDYVCCPPCNSPGTIVGIFDIGHQSVQTKDKGIQEVRKLVLVFELIKKRPDGKPFVMAKNYTWSMRDNSNFYALATGATGKKFKEGEKFNPLSLLGGPVMINVTNTQSGEKTYHDIDAIAQFPDGFPFPTPIYPATSWSVMTGDGFPSGLDWLPYVYGKSIKALAEESAEWRKRGAQSQAQPPAGPGQQPGDGIPF
jgi:hypothetical protein